MMRFLPGFLILLAGCATTTAPEDEGPRGRSLFSWTVNAETNEIDEFLRRARELQPLTALLRTLVLSEPDLAHAAWLICEDRPLRQSIAAASGDPHYAGSEAQREAPEHALARTALRSALSGQEARPDRALKEARGALAIFDRLGDAVWIAEAQLCVGGLELRNGSLRTPLSAPVAAQAAPRRLLELGAAWANTGTSDPAVFLDVAEVADRTNHWNVLQRLDALRSLGVARSLDPEFERTWHRLLARIAIQRHRPLQAVRHGLRALRARERLSRNSAADRVLLARAYLAAGRKEDALVEAQTAVDTAPHEAVQATAQASLGDVLCALGREETAAESYAAAEARYVKLGDAVASTRQAINRSLALLRCGRLVDATSALPEKSLRLVGPHAPDVTARLAIARALVLLIQGDLQPGDAVARIDAALKTAREAGCVGVAQAYAGLVERLRGSKPRPSAGG